MTRPQVGSLQQQQQHQNQTLVNNQVHGNVVSTNSVSKAINIKNSGGDSPVLIPVQTPIEDLPMTPLYLNSDKNSYFVFTKDSHGSTRHSKDFRYRKDIGDDYLDEKDECDYNEEEDQKDINMD